jgi:hypothetical protein
MNRKPKQISVPIETGEENVSEKRVREAQFWALGFSGNRRKGYAVEDLDGGLKTETVSINCRSHGSSKWEFR